METLNPLVRIYCFTAVALFAFMGAYVTYENVFADNATASVDVGNASPAVTAVNISPDPIVLTENTSTTVTITATVSDANGCDFVFTSGSIQAVLYRSGLAATSSCSADDNNCYRNITLSEVGNTCSGGSDTSGDASGTINLWYFAEATQGASSSFNGQTWQAAVTARDQEGASGTSTDATPPVLNLLLALNVAANINYGTLSPNTSSSLAQAQLATVTSTGNYALDAEFSGTDMSSGGNTLAATEERYGTSSAAHPNLTFQLTNSGVEREINLAKASTSAGRSANTYWGINVPSGQVAGSYSGTNTFTAVWSEN